MVPSDSVDVGLRRRGRRDEQCARRDKGDESLHENLLGGWTCCGGYGGRAGPGWRPARSWRNRTHAVARTTNWYDRRDPAACSRAPYAGCARELPARRVPCRPRPRRPAPPPRPRRAARAARVVRPRRSSASCVRALGDRAGAEDVFQQVFLEAWQRGPALRPGRAAPLTWLMTHRPLARRSTTSADACPSRATRRARSRCWRARRTPPPTSTRSPSSGGWPGSSAQLPDEEADLLRRRFYGGRDASARSRRRPASRSAR